MTLTDYLVYAFLFIGAAASMLTKRLTATAAITGVVVGLLIYKGTGYIGLVMLAVFFITGTVATGWRRSKKHVMNRAEEHKSGRTTGQVLANGGVSALLGAISCFYPQGSLLLSLMIAGSLAAATADTLSSELGTVYGRNFYNILTLKKDQRGLDGVISLEGTLTGVIGAAMIAAVYTGLCGDTKPLIPIIIAGVAGNLTDSLLGAWLERRNLIGNNAVNFLNTLAGAFTCLLLSKLMA